MLRKILLQYSKTSEKYLAKLRTGFEGLSCVYSARYIQEIDGCLKVTYILNWLVQVYNIVQKAWKALHFEMRVLNKGIRHTKI